MYANRSKLGHEKEQLAVVNRLSDRYLRTPMHLEHMQLIREWRAAPGSHVQQW